MNVNDQWMLEKMQQMAANMAASLPQAGQNAETPQTEKGDSFRDMLDKAKDQKAETAQKTEGPKKAETVQKKEPVQTVQKTQKAVQTDPKTGLRQIDVTPEEAALLAAGCAKLSPPMEDGTVWMVTVQDENGVFQPLDALGETNAPLLNDVFADTAGEWVLDEITPEFTQALEQLLQKTGDPRPMESILDRLARNTEEAQTARPELEIVVRTLEAGPVERTEQADDEDMTDFGSEIAAKQPLFRDVKAAPVKVGDNFRLDTRQPDMDVNLADAIRYAAQQSLRQIEIKLSPENLGSLTIKLTQSADGTLQVVLHAANSRAASLLSQHAEGLNAALQGYGQNSEVRVEVQRSEDSQQAQQQQQQQTDPNGHNRQSQQQQRQQEEGHSGDFLQKLRLGLFSPEDN